MTACRAIIAVSSPTPGLYDSKAAEVQAVFRAAGDDVDDDADEVLLGDLFGSDAEQASKRDPQKTQAGDRPGVTHAMPECFERLRAAAYKSDHWKARLAAFPDTTAPTVVAWRELHFRRKKEGNEHSGGASCTCACDLGCVSGTGGRR